MTSSARCTRSTARTTPSRRASSRCTSPLAGGSSTVAGSLSASASGALSRRLLGSASFSARLSRRAVLTLIRHRLPLKSTIVYGELPTLLGQIRARIDVSPDGTPFEFVAPPSQRVHPTNERHFPAFPLPSSPQLPPTSSSRSPLAGTRRPPPSRHRSAACSTRRASSPNRPTGLSCGSAPSTPCSPSSRKSSKGRSGPSRSRWSREAGSRTSRSARSGLRACCRLSRGRAIWR